MPKKIFHPLYNLIYIFFSGHYGTGKTVIGAESVKIKRAKYLYLGLKVEVHVLTFWGRYTELSSTFERKWFADVPKSDIKFDTFENFMVNLRKGMYILLLLFYNIDLIQFST